jgi:monoamine oxidase
MRVGQAGGYGAAFTMMQSLGLLGVPRAMADTTKPTPTAGNGARVVILGGGIAGLVAAYELGKAGYACTVLEARDRVGGRNWTVRNGTEVKFTDGSVQRCQFGEDLYFNAGPARLPSIHTIMLGYCKELGVPLEVEINTSRSALMQCNNLNGGKCVQLRQVVNDTRGHVAELLAKSINKGALDQELTHDDKERMLEFLRQYGDLSPDLFFRGTERSGYKVNPGAGAQMPQPNDPLDMHALLDANLWEGMLSEDAIDWQATMFQPIGGMDRIPAAFEKRLGEVVRYGAEVRQIRQVNGTVKVTYWDRKSDTDRQLQADYCICAMPLSIVKKLDTDFASEVKEVIEGASYDSAYKIAWESRRFWEQECKIYGGLSYLNQTVSVVWYPSADLFSSKGVVVGGYGVENGTAFGKLPSQEAKLRASRDALELLHPGRSNELMNPMYVSWGNIPYNLGSWISGFGKKQTEGLNRLLEPDRRVFFAGDHTSHLVGWQEGAALSAYRVIDQIGTLVQKGGTNAA